MWNIAVAGCGPAGLAAALLLHRGGARITLFDRFKIPGPVGSGLMIQPTGLAVLKELGLVDRLLSHGRCIDRLHGQVGTSGRIVLDVRYKALGRTGGFGVGIHRALLFALLHDAVGAAGIPVVLGHTVSGSRLEGDQRRLLFEDGGDAGPFDLVVDALGARSPLASFDGRMLAYGALWANLDWPEDSVLDRAALEQRYRAASVMAGVLPIGTLPGTTGEQASLFWSLHTDRLQSWRKQGLGAWKDEVAGLWPATWPLLDQISDPDQLTFASYAHRTLSAPAEPALIHIGDAWHSASPQLGQGANMALLDAYALAVAMESEPRIVDATDRAIRLRRRHIRIYQMLTALLTPVYQSDSRVLPFVRDRLVGPVSKLWPATWIQAATVGGLVGHPLKPLGLANSRPDAPVNPHRP